MFKKLMVLLVWFVLILSPFFSIADPSINASNSSSSNSTNNSNSSESDDCVQLNTDLPGVPKKICEGDATSSFGSLMGGLMKLLINFVVAVSFIALIASGVMMMFSGINQSTAGKGKELLKKVVIGIILLGLSGIILHTLNPNFFK